ncbi:MAG: foldase protein PrsA, partial [bacterium]
MATAPVRWCGWRVCLFFKRLRPSIPIIFVLTIATAILWITYANKDRQDEKHLDIIGNRVIDKGDFIARYKQLREKIDLPDNGQSRREIFNGMLEEELLIAEAQNRGYDKDAYGRFQRERIQIQELLDAYHRRFVSNGIRASKDELRKLLVQLHTKIKVRHLYAPTLRQAHLLYAELLNGKSFEELAKANFTDPQLRDTGGALGYLTVDEMDPFFEEAAFALDIGQISKPIRTAQGYSIIQVQDRIAHPLLTEFEFAKRRSKLEQYWHHRKNTKATRSYVDSLRQYLDISFNKPVVAELFQSISKRASIPAAVEDGHHLPNDANLNHQALARSKLGVWEVKTFHEHAQFTS